jgi:ribose-phosphate pyrophosphokinase
MTQEIQIRHDGDSYETRSFTFPGGELQVQVPGLPESLSGDITVFARLQSAEALIRLLLATEILSRVRRTGTRKLVIPYFPYARQDRVMQPGEAFSLKAIARLINGLGYDEVIVCDPHSDVTAALVENITVIPQVDLITAHEDIGRIIHSGITIVAPDAGAAKKAFAVARHYGLPLLTASKVRDTKTGQITNTSLDAQSPIDEWSALIVDDICDGGRTFIELAKVLRWRGASRVFLYVTHGIFSQGLGVFAGLIDAVFTTDSFLSREVENALQSPVPLHVSAIQFGSGPCL